MPRSSDAARSSALEPAILLLGLLAAGCLGEGNLEQQGPGAGGGGDASVPVPDGSVAGPDGGSGGRPDQGHGPGDGEGEGSGGEGEGEAEGAAGECQPGQERGCPRAPGAGDCGPRIQRCGADGSWGACFATDLRPEVCDGRDNDCNGTADDLCECRLGLRLRIDHDLPGSGYREESENWATWETDPCGPPGYRYLSRTVGDGTRRGRAIWQPTITVAGWYRVTSCFRATGNRGRRATYRVFDDQGGRVERLVDQYGDPGRTVELDFGRIFCAAGGGCRLVLVGDDGGSYVADLTTFVLQACSEQEQPPLQGCAGIAANPAYELCFDGGDVCHGVFTDGSGCAAFCAAAGMTCVARFGGEPGCSKEPQNVLRCGDENGHQSDWCECARR